MELLDKSGKTLSAKNTNESIGMSEETLDKIFQNSIAPSK
jgi:hypothetical protein